MTPHKAYDLRLIGCADRVSAERLRHRCCSVAFVALLFGCAVSPVELEQSERERIASESLEKLFSGQELVSKPLSLYEATARAVKYQTEYRVKIMEEAAALAQIDVARFDLLPKLAVNAGYSTRNNDSFGFGFSPNGTPATNPSASSERTHNTASVGLVWNVMDFGVSYFRSKQLADQKLAATERRRKAVQNLIQDVRLAWWRAEAAQRLLPVIDAYFEEVEQTIEKTRIIESRKLLPPMQTASLRRALLDLQQQISLRREELAQARIELASIVNAPPGTEVLVSPPDDYPAATLNLKESIPALEAVALRNRPEIAEEVYKSRISVSEARKAILGLLPGLNFDLTGNYDSNRYLVNNYWTSAGLSVAFNLVKAFSYPAVKRSNEAQQRLDESRRLAMAMAVLTQTRIAAVRFGLMAHEYGVWDEATLDDRKIVQFLESSAEVGIDTELELIRAKGRYTVSKINRDIMYANLEAALGRIYNSTGLDPGTLQADKLGMDELASQMKTQIADWQTANFAPKTAQISPSVSIADITGVPAGTLIAFRDSLGSVFAQSKLNVTSESDAQIQLFVGIELASLKGGGRPATVKVRLVDKSGRVAKFNSEFKTTLSEPVDEEQWRTLAEGAAFRLLGPMLRQQAVRAVSGRQSGPASGDPELKFASAIQTNPVSVVAPIDLALGDDAPIYLRLDSGAAWIPASNLSVSRLGEASHAK